MKIICRKIISGLFHLASSFVMWLPCSWIRKNYLRLFGARIGKDVCIMRNVEVRCPRNIRIGNNVVINKLTLLDGRGGEVIIGENVDIAQEVIIWTQGHDPNDDYHSLKNGRVIIENYAWLGCRSMIMPGVVVGKGGVVAAGSIVTKSVASMTIVAGIPASKIANRKSALKYNLCYNPYFI